MLIARSECEKDPNCGRFRLEGEATWAKLTGTMLRYIITSFISLLLYLVLQDMMLFSYVHTASPKRASEESTSEACAADPWLMSALTCILLALRLVFSGPHCSHIFFRLCVSKTFLRLIPRTSSFWNHRKRAVQKDHVAWWGKSNDWQSCRSKNGCISSRVSGVHAK